MWAPRLRLNECLGCGESDRRHYQAGYCCRCFRRLEHVGRVPVGIRTAIPDLNPVQWAYVAGLLDGEACFTAERPRLYRGRRYRGRIKITVGMTHELTIRWLAETLGGAFRLARLPQANHKPVWTWTVMDRRAELVVEGVLPYVRVKRIQAHLLMAFREADRQDDEMEVERIKVALLAANQRGFLPYAIVADDGRTMFDVYSETQKALPRGEL